MMSFTFAELLRSFRQRASLDQAALAAGLGVHTNSISGWERGQHRPKDRDIVLRLAEELSLTPAETDQLLRAADFPAAHDTLDPQKARYQLRTPVADFAGRAAEIRQLRAALQEAVAPENCAIISGVRGMGGVGKTELAYRVAHDLRATFPDAQIVIELRGTSAAPLTAVHALQAAIRAFLPNAPLPAEQADLERLYRSLLHRQHVLILADDARDAAQVRPLIPPSGSALLITSRQCFALPGMIAFDLEQLGEAEAICFLRQICNRLSTAEAEAIGRVCGYLPLALRISGGMLHNDPALSTAAYVTQLDQVQHCLSQLRDPEDTQLDVAASLNLSYSLLDPAAQQVFRRLGVLVADFATELAQAVVGADLGVVIEEMLRGLLRRNLVMYDADRVRWRLHDLVRALALSLLEPCEREAAEWRYVRAAIDLAQATQKQYITGGDAALIALARFDTERPHIDAARRWATDRAGTLLGDGLLVEEARVTSFIGEMRYDRRRERLPQLEEARAAAQRIGDQPSEARMLNNLGLAFMHLGEFQQAIAYFQQTLDLVRTLGDQRGEGVALGNLGMTYSAMGDVRQAITYLEQVLAITRAMGDQSAEGLTYNHLGDAYHTLGDNQRARDYYEQNLAIARATGYQRDESLALYSLGLISYHQGEVQPALQYHTLALSIARAIGDRQQEGSNLLGLGLAYELLGNGTCAIDSCTQALEIAREIDNRPLEGQVLIGLGRIYTSFGDTIQAASAFEEALTSLQAVGNRAGVAGCRLHYGLFLAHQGEHEQALALLRAAVAYEQEIGHMQADEHALLLARLEAGETLNTITSGICNPTRPATPNEFGA